MNQNKSPSIPRAALLTALLLASLVGTTSTLLEAAIAATALILQVAPTLVGRDCRRHARGLKSRRARGLNRWSCRRLRTGHHGRHLRRNWHLDVCNGLFLITGLPGLGPTFISKDRDIHNLDRIAGTLGRRSRVEISNGLVFIFRYECNITNASSVGVWDVDNLD